MPIIFTVKQNEGYFVSRFTGQLTDDDILQSRIRFLEGDQWQPSLNELADVSQMDNSLVSKDLFQKLAQLISYYYQRHSSGPTKLALFAPRPVQHGMSRMYIAWADESSQTIRIFDDIEEAKSWVRVV